MTLSQAAIHVLSQLTDLVKQIDDRDLVKCSAALSGSTIGQHLRHTIEFFICFESGYMNGGTINYDKRAHDRSLETDKVLILSSLERAVRFVSTLPPDKPVTLEAGYDTLCDTCIPVLSNTTRELVYNIEHAVHHMAIIKIGIREVAPYVQLPPYFGVAASTVRHAESARPSEKSASA